nr:MAG TPA: minor tail protein [Caudoviricetes sp.]
MADGSLIFDTKVDTGGIDGALKKIAGIAAASGAVADIAKTGVEFEASMSKVQAVSGATKQQLESLTKLAREYGASTVFSSSECADALNYMSMAGWNVEQMTSGLPGVLNLAAAAGEDLGTTSDIVTDALTAFGMQAEEAGHFADILATASSKSNTNVSMMGETFKYVAPVAGALGYSAEDIAVAVGLMANNGIKAGQAGTSLRAVLSNLTEPTDKQAAAMNELGISLTDSEGNMKTLDTLLGDMRRSFSGLDESTKASYASILAGQEGMSGLLAIVNTADTDFNNLKSAIYDCDGACETMAGTMTDNVSGEMKTLESMVEELELSLYDMFQPMLKDAIPKVQDAVEWITEHLDEIISFAKPISKALVSAFAVNKVVKSSQAIIKAIKGIGTAMKTNPLGALLTAIELVGIAASAVSGFVTTWGMHLDEVYKNAAELPDTMKAIKDKTSEAADEWERLKESSENAISDENIDYNAIQKMKDRLSELVDADGKIQEGAESEVKAILDKINGYTGACYDVSDGLITKNGEVVDSYKKISSEIDTLTTKAHAQAVMGAYEDDYKVAVKGKDEALYNISEAETEIGIIRQKITEAAADIENFKRTAGKDNFGRLSDDDLKILEEKTVNLSGLYKNLETQKGILSDNEILLAKYESLQKDYDSLTTALQQDDMDAIKKFTDSLSAGIVHVGDEASISAIEENIHRLEGLRDRAKEIYKKNPTEENRDEWNYYQTALFEQIFEWQAYQNQFKEKGKNGAKELLTGAGDTLKNDKSAINAATDQGSWIAQGLANGIYNSMSDVVRAAKAMASAVSNETNSIHSPSSVRSSVQIEGNARGTTNSSDIFVAGEEGPELIVGKKGSTVFPFSETAKIVNAVSGLLPNFNTSGIYNSLAAPTSFSPFSGNSFGNSETTSSQQVPAPQSNNSSPIINVYIGDDQIRNFVVEAVTDANANSGGWSV